MVKKTYLTLAAIATLCVIGVLAYTMWPKEYVATVTLASPSREPADAASEQARFYQVTDHAVLNGDAVRAIQVAYADFSKNREVPTTKRSLKGYYIAIDSRKSTYYAVWFLPRLLPNETSLVGGETPLGREVRYHVDKTTFRVTSIEFPE